MAAPPSMLLGFIIGFIAGRIVENALKEAERR